MNKEKILIIARSHIGDFIWATSAISIIRKRKPEAEITVIAPKSLSAIIINNQIFNKAYFYNSRLIESPKKILRIAYKLFLIAKSLIVLRTKRFSKCFLFSPEAFFIKFSTYLSPKEFIYAAYECCGFDKQSSESVILEKRVKQKFLKKINTPKDANNTHCSEIYQSIVRGYFNITDIALPNIPASTQNEKSLLLKTSKKSKIALCIRASAASQNKYPPEYFAKIVSVLSQKTSSAFFILGGKEQHGYVEKFISQLSNNIEISNLTGKTTLLETRNILNLSDLLISVDTGIPHIAATTGIKMITLFGMASPNAVMPMSPNNTSFYASVDCSPCIYNLNFGIKACPYGNNPKCMEMIKPDDIIKTALELLAKTNGDIC